MRHINRRGFLRNAAAGAVGVPVGMAMFQGMGSRALGANEEIRLAVAGLNGQGNYHVNNFMKLPGVKVVAVVEPDSSILERRLGEYKERYADSGGADIKGYADIRHALDRDDVDGVVIGTPNHWHSLMTIWACQAGKHVYVEKPVSHTVWEGRKMVEAARKYERVVQAGTQQRSCPAVQEAGKDLQDEMLGKVLWIHCSKLGARGPIGKVTEPQAVPGNIDYNLWAGPAPMTPVMRRSFHYDWHWQWNWGDGEMGNWGIHYIDDLLNMMGWGSVPTSVIAAGERFAWDDNGETPNMHFALFQYGDVPVVVDIRNLPDPERPEGKRAGGNDGAVYLRSRGGNYIQCENGYIQLARGGGSAYDNDGNRIKQYRGDGGGAHAGNWIDAIRNGRPQDLNSDIETCHLSTLMCHQANIGFRVGAAAPVEEVRAAMQGCDDAVNTLSDMLEQLEGNKVNLADTPFVLGPKLTFDPAQERFVGDNADRANPYLTYEYRDGFAVPANV